MSKYLEHFFRSEKSRTNFLQRDAQASHSVIVTWQISFDQIRQERSSAEELLSLMSFFGRQGIPEFVLQSHSCSRGDEVDMNSDVDKDFEFEDDLAMSKSYCLITMNIEGSAFEMHQLV